MATASPLPISMSEYLHSRYQPDCDYVDGIVETRNVGAADDSKIQNALVAYCNSRNWGVHAEPEARIQTSASHVRVADVAVIAEDAARIEDYRRMGIKSIRVVDPAARKGFDCSSGSWVETEHFAASESPVHIDLPAFFAAIGAGRA